ncbi:hypothetical protein BU24DRAFT_428634 [Aaosphaeria arxii CBS 175.79]|uniref:Uncharacterized protein n=1 Tax=Aaosphaeria arxii CBS 175.79 TaxID=1450172 RepID=A0A6A5X9Y0_9PLEO|nr:uncharacterized protein BU24DRAFT_428634 [Aaosphaeria arxii CBS 175.79]KAF2009762.1 hypothetical protein BU24DRAFT_428634 [Aaosphaeria arxii CBS 175.79]
MIGWARGSRETQAFPSKACMTGKEFHLRGKTQDSRPGNGAMFGPSVLFSLLVGSLPVPTVMFLTWSFNHLVNEKHLHLCSISPFAFQVLGRTCP